MKNYSLSKPTKPLLEELSILKDKFQKKKILTKQEVKLSFGSQSGQQDQDLSTSDQRMTALSFIMMMDYI
jgi:hypothetical protein